MLRRPNRLPLLLAALSLVLAACVAGDPAPGVRFGDQRYLITTSFGLTIAPPDLEAMGEVQAIDDPWSVRSLTAYRLAGVDPTQLFVMDSAKPEFTGTYLIAYRWESVPRKSTFDESPEVGHVRFVNAFPGLCRYDPAVPCPP